MMLRLNDVQQALIQKIKASATITGKLADPLDVREVEWQGTKFKMPNIRVRVTEFERRERNPSCNLFNVTAVILVFADDASSYLINDIASDVFDLFDTVSTSEGTVKLQGISAKQAGAAWIDEGGLWRSEVMLTMMASQK